MATDRARVAYQGLAINRRGKSLSPGVGRASLPASRRFSRLRRLLSYTCLARNHERSFEKQDVGRSVGGNVGKIAPEPGVVSPIPKRAAHPTAIDLHIGNAACVACGEHPNNREHRSMSRSRTPSARSDIDRARPPFGMDTDPRFADPSRESTQRIHTKSNLERACRLISCFGSRFGLMV